MFITHTLLISISHRLILLCDAGKYEPLNFIFFRKLRLKTSRNVRPKEFQRCAAAGDGKFDTSGRNSKILLNKLFYNI